MNRISKVFENKKALIAYLTAGDPTIQKTLRYILTMVENGADLIEIGVPFSDPIAEGETIQNAMTRALSNNIKLDDIFGMVLEVRKKTDIPLVFMTYLNPVLFYGYEKFFNKCKTVGIDGIIVPDMPFEEQDEIKTFAKKYGITIISLIAPTSDERIEMIAKQAEGFIYLVSSLGVTGVRNKITSDIKSIVSKIKKTANIPVAVGFGISTPQQAKETANDSDGIIIGSAIVKIIAENEKDTQQKLASYILEIKKSLYD